LPGLFKQHTITTLIDTAITFIIPSFIIFTLNILIVITIKRVSHPGSCDDIPYSRHELSMTTTEDQYRHMVCSWTREKNGVGTPRTSIIGLHKSSISRNSVANKTCCNGAKFRVTDHGRERAKRRTARMLLCVSTCFLILNLPKHSFKLYGFLVSSFDHGYQMPKPALKLQIFSENLHILHFVLNFFLYFYARQFSEALRKLMDRIQHKFSPFCDKTSAPPLCCSVSTDSF
jgi:hypothetical protein